MRAKLMCSLVAYYLIPTLSIHAGLIVPTWAVKYANNDT